MLTIIHAADFHLDSPFAALREEQAVLRRREQRTLLRELREKSADADLVLLPGDLLDSGLCHAETAEALSDFLNSFACPVFIAPGNHDYYAPESPYARMTLRENIHIFTGDKPEAVSLPELGCTVWGAAFTAFKSTKSPLRSFTAPKDGSLHIMALHGDVNGGNAPYAPITEAEIAASGLNYLALGHVHACSGLRKSGAASWAYSGCLMGRGFDETGAKGFLRVELDADSCKAEFVPLSGRQYRLLPVDVTGAESLLGAVRSALPADAPEQIFRVLLQGEWPEKPNTEALCEALASFCFQAEVRDETRVERDLWEAVGEDTLRGCFLRILKEKYDAAADAEKPRIMLAARFGLAALDDREEL